MSRGSVGRPPSLNCTEWVKLSWFVHVTVVPTCTVMSAGTNLYDGGRSTVEVATGAALVPPPEPELEQAARATASPTMTPTKERRMVGRLVISGSRGGAQPVSDGDEHEDERDEVEDLADRVGEEEHGPVEVVGHVRDLGQGEQRERPAEGRLRGPERAPREVRADREVDDVDREASEGRTRVDEATERHGASFLP